MSGSLLPFRRGQPRTATRGPAAFSSGPRDTRRPEPAGAAAPLPRPSEASRFRELIEPHIDAAYSLARYLTRDATAAEDIAQEALLKAIRAGDSLRGEVRPWLLTIVRNTYFDWRRRDSGRVVTGPAADVVLAETPDEAQPSAESALIRQGDVAALRTAIETIPEPFREALVLRDLDELSYRDVAQITGVPMGTVMSRLARARRMLGERMGVLEATA
ncbi:MAG TPA: sigma-70 family RNA polymerase sigma factor [Caulobacteraceae bacterium]|jgi:RNA polymerase sigma-70 factor (ECF subfamily)